MFARRHEVEAASEETYAPAPTRPEKVAPSDAQIFQPSSFASRKAGADARNAELSKRRLVSLGASDFTQRTKNGEIESIPVELFCDIDHPSQRFAQFPGPHGGLVPLQGDTGPTERVQTLRSIPGRRLSRPESSAFPPAQMEPPPQPV